MYEKVTSVISWNCPAVKQLNLAKSEVVQRFSSQNAIEWRFIPPKASHHGGTWERMIRTIRKVATGVLQNNDRMTDEILSTFFCEVENIVNQSHYQTV